MRITEFLEARISEDETVIERRGSFPHSIHSSDIMGTFSPHCADCLGLPGRARVVAECAAKRVIIGNANYTALNALAAVYANHPDYRQEWDA